MNRTSTYKTTSGEGFCCEPQAQSRNARSLPTQNVDYEKLQYYYHSDHLGSASYITNLDGEVVQHVEYVPFGEVFIEERNNTWNTPYLFNGKELDEETGLYYYGARYYNPRTSLWLSVDPLAEKYPSMSPYNYCANNPVVFVDPDGNVIVPIILYYLGKRVYNENISKWNRLNNHERHIIKWDPEFYKALDIEKNATETTTMTRKQYGRNGKGDESDAFRHTFWQARNTQDVGEDFTRKFADAHEYGTPLEEIDTDLVMDIHNNEVGIEIGNNNLDATPEELVNIIQKRMADGDMLILKGGKLVKSNGEEVKAGEVRGLNKSMDIGNVIFQEPEKQKGKQYEKIE